MLQPVVRRIVGLARLEVLVAAPTFEDGRRALILANTALQSHETGRVVKVDYGG